MGDKMRSSRRARVTLFDDRLGIRLPILLAPMARRVFHPRRSPWPTLEDWVHVKL